MNLNRAKNANGQAFTEWCMITATHKNTKLLASTVSRSLRVIIVDTMFDSFSNTVRST
jgi:hypothetical protein